MPIAVEILSPEKLLLSRSVDMVVIPAAEGDMGVLSGHAPMAVLLRGGVVRFYSGQNVTEQLFVCGGFAQVTGERVSVLVTESFSLDALSKAEGERRLAAAQAAFDSADKQDAAALAAATEQILTARAWLLAARA
jgi:F-type H+-transporting ATPase subunit epsilon